MTSRTLAASIFAVIAVISFVGLYASYQRADDARRIAEASRDALRVNRRVSEYKLCKAVNEGRQINNRDRATFVKAIRETKRDLRVIHDPTLHAILVRSLAQSKHELAVRPHLVRLSCVRLVIRPSRKGTPPVLTNLTTTSR